MNDETSSKQGKVWGYTECVFKIPGIVEVWTIFVHPGGYCSKHLHKYKHNKFVVLDGGLTVEIWKSDYDLVDKVNLEPGESTVVKRGEYHKFINQSLDDVKAIEIYWSDFDVSDIERDIVGGWNKNETIN